jgi:hypothetical protein
MRDRFAQLQLDGLVGQQAQTPTGVACGRSRARQGSNSGALCAVDSDGSPGARLVKESGVEPCAQVTALDVEDGLKRDLQGGRDLFRMLAAVQEIEDAGARLRPRRRRSAFDDGCQRAQFVLR